MKNLKRLTALGLAATMVVGSGVTAFAGESEGTDTGEGKYEGYVDETSVFSVDVPTDAANVFDFFVDPNGLLEATGYARLSAQATDFEDGATLFFNRDGEAGVDKKYGKTSKKITAKNMSSYDVNIEISAAVSGADGIEFAETNEVSSAEAPTLYLALTDGSETKAISADGGLLTGTIEGYADNFEIKYDGGEYKYALKSGVNDSDSNWKTYSFQLTGACGGTWTDEQSEVAPTVALTWKVTDPKSEAAPSIKTTSYTMTSGESVSVALNFGAGELAATGVKSVTYKNSSNADKTVDSGSYAVEGTTLRFKASFISSLISGGVSNRTYTVTFNDAANTKVNITLSTAD